MKKFLTIALIAFSMMVFVACGGSKKDKDNSDTGDTDVVDTTDTSDTAPAGDTGDPDSDDPDSEDPDSEAQTDECTGVSIEWDMFFYYSYYGVYFADANLGDEELEDSFVMEFIDEEGYPTVPAAGSYELGTGLNTNYKTCSECIMINQDYVESENEDESGSYNKTYFQESGSLKIEKVDDYSNIVGTISAKLVEVTVNGETYESTPVKGGACLEIETANFDSGYEEPCVPQCDNRSCGDDGCGGVCGVCESGEGCNLDFECAPFVMPETCPGLSLEWDSLYQSNLNAFYALSEEETGPMAKIVFYQDELGLITPGTYDLGSDANKEYSTCTECVFAYSDVDEDGYYMKNYFQREGTLEVSSVGKNNEIAGTISAKLVETLIAYDAEGNIVTTPMVGGSCFEIETGTEFATPLEEEDGAAGE